MAGFGGEAALIGQILTAYAGRTSGAREFALANRVLLL
jgi:hypothetical protein